MTPRTRIAQKNLRAGIRKMENTMTPAAQVRRDFRLGRPPKAVEELRPLHPDEAWRKATDALANFRARMIAAELNPSEVVGFLIFIELANPDRPNRISLELPGTSAEERKAVAYQLLMRPDVLTLGMVFTQWDERGGTDGGKSQVTFPYQFTGLNERGIAVLRQAALDVGAGIKTAAEGPN